MIERAGNIHHDVPATVSRRAVLSGSACAGLATLVGSRAIVAQAAATPKRPFPQRPLYARATIRPSSRSQDEQDDDVRAAYDAWKTNYLVDAGADTNGGAMMRVAFGQPGTSDHDATVSEGQGFGMIIVSHLAGHDPDAQTIFDGLWRFARANPSEIDPRLMNWKIPPEFGIDSAFDGDADMAYGLLLADAQWGSDGEIDYRAAADVLLAAIYESTIGSESRLPLLGDWVDQNGEPHNQWTVRTSDFMLGHFRAYGRATKNDGWAEVVGACQRVIAEIQTNHSPETGLLPDFVMPVSASDHTARPADPGLLEGDTDGTYSYNAGRTPWRLGTDALINADPTSFEQVRKISTWIESATGGDPDLVLAGYTLDGAPLDGYDYFTSFFASPFAVAAMTNPDQQAWLDALYEAVRDRVENYYEDSVTLLCLLVLTGTFWDPTLLFSA